MGIHSAETHAAMSEEGPLARNMWETAIFGFTVTALVFSVPGNLPGIWEGPERTAANFVYGSPQCVESLLRSTGIDIRDNEQLIQPGFHEPFYASPKKYDAFMYQFGDALPVELLECAGVDGGVTAPANGATCFGAARGDDSFGYTVKGHSTQCTGAVANGEPVGDWPLGGQRVVSGTNTPDAVGANDYDADFAACSEIFPYPLVTTGDESRILSGQKNNGADRIWGDVHDRFATTQAMQGLTTDATAATTTTTRPATTPTFSYDQANIVFNVYYNQSVSPYLNAEKDQNRCERILAKMRGDVANGDWDFFRQQNLGELMMCNVVYGWALGEYCSSMFDEVNAHLVGDKPENDGTVDNTNVDKAFAALTDAQRSAARNQCENVTRTTCGERYGAAGVTVRNHENDGEGIGASATPIFMAAGATEANANDAVAGFTDNPCFMKSGYGRSNVNNGRLFGNFKFSVVGEDGPVVPGSEMSPSVLEQFYKDLSNGAVAKPNHFVDIGTQRGDTTKTQDKMAISIGGNPGEGFTDYNTRESEAAANTADYTGNIGDGPSFGRVSVPVTGVDSRYIYERLVYDFLVLGQMADKIGREDDFYNMLPAECFSDGSGSSVRAGTRFTWTVFLVTLLLFLLPRLPGISALTEDYGYTLPLPRVDKIGDSNGLVSEATQTKIIFLLSMIVGILGFSISMSINPDGPGARDGEVSGIQDWATVLDQGNLLSAVDTFYDNEQTFMDETNNENTRSHRTYQFLNDIANGNYHRAYGLDEDEQYNAYILSIMCAMITVLGVVLILFKRVGKGEGSAVLSQGKLIGDWA